MGSLRTHAQFACNFGVSLVAGNMNKSPSWRSYV